MDIEGAEVDVLNGSREFLTDKQNVKIVCCTYHRLSDGEMIPRLLTDMGYHYEFSDGYMFHDMNSTFFSFRRGLVRAWE